MVDDTAWFQDPGMQCYQSHILHSFNGETVSYDGKNLERRQVTAQRVMNIQMFLRKESMQWSGKGQDINDYTMQVLLRHNGVSLLTTEVHSY